ncbi:hypothetical protein [uncultured Helicobacter sp.]|uniref:hypothetical protein n=1 Tax=uncultured Helicobacter sp. TaxID=175537 RepID=UPI00262208A1|nr:hypothetical protein [uncultured Helicobacter sp.]
MLILNHPYIESLKIARVRSKEEIANTLPSDFLVLTCDSLIQTLALARYCSSNTITYASLVTSIKESLLLVNLNVQFLLCTDINLAKSLQKLAETYLFDAKILLCIQKEEEIEKIAEYGIDGVLFASF